MKKILAIRYEIWKPRRLRILEVVKRGPGHFTMVECGEVMRGNNLDRLVSHATTLAAMYPDEYVNGCYRYDWLVGTNDGGHEINLHYTDKHWLAEQHGMPFEYDQDNELIINDWIEENLNDPASISQA